MKRPTNNTVPNYIVGHVAATPMIKGPAVNKQRKFNYGDGGGDISAGLVIDENVRRVVKQLLSNSAAGNDIDMSLIQAAITLKKTAPMVRNVPIVGKGS